MSPRLSSYLDYNATAPIWPEAADAAARALALTGNPSAVHGYGRGARALIDDARERIAAVFGARPGELVFTSGGTEANMLAIGGVAVGGAIDRVIVSAIEHPSVIEAARATGLPVTRLPVSEQGIVDVDALPALLADGPRALVSVMSANNETGVIQPVGDVIRMSRAAGAFVHVDAVQSAGREALAFEADLMTLSAHKLGGPPGTGALLVKDRVPLGALMPGGGQERRRRGGTENIAGIAGFSAAVQKLAEIRDAQARIGALRDRLEAGIRAIAPDAKVFGARAPRLANTSCVATPGFEAALQVMSFDLAGIAVSAGSACSSGKVERSAVLTAMGAGERAGEAIRVSLGWHTEAGEIDRFLEIYAAMIARRTQGDRRVAGARA